MTLFLQEEINRHIKSKVFKNKENTKKLNKLGGYKMKTLEGHIILKPWNPNMVWTGEPEYTKITRLYMSVGNGDDKL